MNRFLALLSRQTGKKEDELKEVAAAFEALADKLKGAGVQWKTVKALVDEDSGARVEADELAAGVAAVVVSALADAGVEVADDVVERIASAVEEMLAEFAAAAEEAEAPSDEEMRAWSRKSVELLDQLLDADASITAIADGVGDLTEAVKALAPLAERIGDLEKSVKRLERTARTRKPASNAPETEVALEDIPANLMAQIKAQIAAENEEADAGRSKIIPSDVYKEE